MGCAVNLTVRHVTSEGPKQSEFPYVKGTITSLFNLSPSSKFSISDIMLTVKRFVD